MDDVTGVRLTRDLIRGYLVQSTVPGKVYELAELRRLVAEEHEDNGGEPSENKNPDEQFKKSLADLKQSGEFENLPGREGLWRRVGAGQFPEHDVEKFEAEEMAEVHIGGGSQTVYGWYLPAYRKLAELEGKTRFPIKVGRSDRPAQVRVNESVGTLPERPVIGFVLKVDDAHAWERFFHARLAIMGSHLNDAIGHEWFNTNLDELAGIAKEGSAPLKSPKQEDNE